MRPFEKGSISSRLKSTKTGQTRFPLPHSHIDLKNYENWNLAIIWHHGSNKSGFVEIRGRLQNGYFQRPKFHSDYSKFSFGHNVLFPLWNFDFSDSLERYSQLDPNIFGFVKIRFILNPAHSFEIWNRIIELPRHFQFLLYI